MEGEGRDRRGGEGRRKRERKGGGGREGGGRGATYQSFRGNKEIIKSSAERCTKIWESWTAYTRAVSTKLFWSGRCTCKSNSSASGFGSAAWKKFKMAFRSDGF
jgi:hypothetical protein